MMFLFQVLDLHKSFLLIQHMNRLGWRNSLPVNVIQLVDE